jgi:hypothetical protein
MISARLYLRLGIHKARQLILSDLLLVAAWCAAVATASLDIVFYKKNVLRPDVNYTLSNFEASPADFEYTLRVSRTARSAALRATCHQLLAFPLLSPRFELLDSTSG